MKLLTGRGLLVGTALLTTLSGTPVMARPHVATPAKPNHVAAEPKAAAAARLDQARLAACQRRETNINAIMERMAAQADKHIGVFDKISQRVQAFYQAKGRSVANYDALVADVTAQRAAAAAAAAKLGSASGFRCDGDDPKGSITAFKAELKSTRTALQAYRTAVKNLIVGVKSAVGAEQRTKPEQPKAPDQVKTNSAGAQR
ncbi:hypothetical protein KY386_03980 [Candidatus Parcubacteria bacterium]|nr:hypothetical protein [Candidatus Parcubacteria bacterium]